MILTCPNCSSQFKVSLEVLGNKGRNVRCSACGETWFEDSYLSELDKDASDNDSEIFESYNNNEKQNSEIFDNNDIEKIDIPDAVKPQEDSGYITDRLVFNKNHNNGSDTCKKTSYFISAIVFIVILAYLLFFSSSIMQSSPYMQAFYSILGIRMEVPTSDKVTFANLQASEDKGVIKVSGDIINLTDDIQVLKMLEISLKGGDGSEDNKIKWYAAPPKAILGAEESIKFISEYKLEKNSNTSFDVVKEHYNEGKEKKEKKYIIVRFVLSPALSSNNIVDYKKSMAKENKYRLDTDSGSKIDVKVGGNNQAHHEGESDH